MKSLLEPRNQEQRDQQARVQNFGAGEEFLDRYFKFETFNLALEAVDTITKIKSGEYEQEWSDSNKEASGEAKEKITKALTDNGIAAESVNEELVNGLLEVVGVEKYQEPTPWEVIEGLACEAVGIDEETEKPTPEQMEDFRNVVSQMTHALGAMTGHEEGAELAFESVDSENSDQLSRTCTLINDQLIHYGVDDDELALEYVLDAPTVCDADDEGEIAIEKIQIKFVGGKKTKVKKRKKKIRGAALAALKKAGRRAGKKKKSAATRKLMARSMKKRKKAGF